MHRDLQEVRWGIIGCGDVTEVKSGPALSKIERSSLVAVMRRNGDRARDYAIRHGVSKWYDDADELIRDDEVNAVYVATPPDSHCEYTLRALDAGKPVYVEKPMARTHQECSRMIDSAEENRLPLLVAYYRRMLPSFLHIKTLIDSGAIGEVRLVQVKLHAAARPAAEESAESNWRVSPEIAGGGYFVDLGAHQFDYLDYIFGPVVDVRGIGVNQAGLYEAEDAVSASWRHESGVIGSGSWCFTASPGSETEETLIVGSDGSIRFSFFGEPTVRLEAAKKSDTFQFQNPKNIQEPLIATVVGELRGRSKCPSTGVSGARATRVMESVLTSGRSPRS